MATMVQILPSVTLVVNGGDTITLNDLQRFITHADGMDIPWDQPLKTKLSAPYRIDQFDQSPGSFSIVAEKL